MATGGRYCDGAVLAMLIVYLFLGNLRHTLIIGTAIPLAITVTMIRIMVECAKLFERLAGMVVNNQCH